MKLALPFTVGYILDGVFDAVAVAMLSQYFSYRDIAAYALVDLFMGTTDDFVGGIIDSMDTLNSHALGMENGYLVGQQIQIASIIYSLANIFPLDILEFCHQISDFGPGVGYGNDYFGPKIGMGQHPQCNH
mmetsp:Transcript_27722/g.28126  ORF Transcript_27722/g.28126 Transcript_27722/m.28126 type:complete len:131 (+) Transcript_27722:129-521(+)